MYGQLLGVICAQLETTLKRDIEKYVMIFDCKNNTVEFKIDNDEKRIPYDEPALADGIRAYLESEVKTPNVKVLYGFIFYDKVKGARIDLHLMDETTQTKTIESVAI